LRACLQAPIADWRAGLLAEYRRQLHVVLSGPHGGAAITQRALLGTVGTLYAAALDALVVSEAQVQGVAIERGRSALTPPLLACFEGCNDALIATALEFNRGSCALSNFPQEHRPSAETLHAIRLDLAAAWREFALTLNARLLPRSVA
ncbi:MAG TPA: amine oxidase, partial [Plasticicumulans sp.]|nr:amine oxidase [Plasticicumulans sp.]